LALARSFLASGGQTPAFGVKQKTISGDQFPPPDWASSIGGANGRDDLSRLESPGTTTPRSTDPEGFSRGHPGSPIGLATSMERVWPLGQ